MGLTAIRCRPPTRQRGMNVLTDTRIGNIRPADGAIRLADSRGLYLEITPSGGRYWRYRFRIKGKKASAPSPSIRLCPWSMHCGNSRAPGIRGRRAAIRSTGANSTQSREQDSAATLRPWPTTGTPACAPEGPRSTPRALRAFSTRTRSPNRPTYPSSPRRRLWSWRS